MLTSIGRRMPYTRMTQFIAAGDADLRVAH
jgi:hypothetical protein